MNAYLWDHGTNLRDMLRAIELQSASRKNRLFSCTCARRLLRLIRDDILQQCVDVAELFLEFKASKEQLKNARKEAQWRIDESVKPEGIIRSKRWRLPDPAIDWDYLGARFGPQEDTTLLTKRIAAAVCDTSTPRSPQLAPVVWWSYHSIPPDDGAYFSLLRDIFGNPFRPVTFDPAWRTEAAVGIAQAAYDSREFGNLPVLADALQDAGCEHPDVLAHLRGPGPHVRGCWAVDLVLGKA